MSEALKNREEHRILLPNASWETYERLLVEREERRSPRFFYDRGVLEILSPGEAPEHDGMSRVIAALVELLAEEADVDLFNAGSTTFKREDLSRGFEPDECFYFGVKAGRVRELVAGKGNLDLDSGDPVPDIVVEVDITSPSLNKLPIYARLGVRESLAPRGEPRTAGDPRAGGRERRRRAALCRKAGERLSAGDYRRGSHTPDRRGSCVRSSGMEAQGARVGAGARLGGSLETALSRQGCLAQASPDFMKSMKRFHQTWYKGRRPAETELRRSAPSAIGLDGVAVEAAGPAPHDRY